MRITRFGLRLDEDRLTSGLVHSPQPALLEFSVGNVGIAGLHCTLVAIRSQRNPPVGIADTRSVGSPRRTPVATIVLRTAIDIVERGRIIHRYFIVLHHR